MQARPLALVDSPQTRSKARVKGEPLLAGGRTVYPGRVSGPAFLVNDLKTLGDTPQGAILFLRKSSPEIVTVFPRVSGVVAEMGNVAGHAASLLREAKIPSIFELSGAFERVKNGDPVSLDAVQPRIYSGMLWPPSVIETANPGTVPGIPRQSRPDQPAAAGASSAGYLVLRFPPGRLQVRARRAAVSVTRRRLKPCSP